MNKVAKIGVVAKQLNGSIGVGAQYWDYFSTLGEVVMVNPLSSEMLKLDLLVLPGGPDIKIQGDAVPSAHTGSPDVFLEYFDSHMLGIYIDAGTSVLGICRGFQTLNAHFGGQITQHLRMETSFSRYELIEKIVMADETEISVNSMHHQAVMPEQLASCLEIVAISKEYGNVEAFSHPDKSIFAVQWHPEEVHEKASAAYLVRSAVSEMLVT